MTISFRNQNSMVRGTSSNNKFSSGASNAEPGVIKIGAAGKLPCAPAPDGNTKARPLSIALVPGNPVIVKLVREHVVVEAVIAEEGAEVAALDAADNAKAAREAAQERALQEANAAREAARVAEELL